MPHVGRGRDTDGWPSTVAFWRHLSRAKELAVDHSRVPVIEALEAFWARGDVVYGPPGHRQGRGVDPRVLEILGRDVFAADVLSLNGLDDRRESQGVLEQAQELM